MDIYTKEYLDKYTTHGDVRKRTYSQRMEKWKIQGRIEGLENLFAAVFRAATKSGKTELSLPEFVAVIRLHVGRLHEDLSKITGQKPKYTFKKALRALKKDLGIDLED